MGSTQLKHDAVPRGLPLSEGEAERTVPTALAFREQKRAYSANGRPSTTTCVLPVRLGTGSSRLRPSAGASGPAWTFPSLALRADTPDQS